MLIFTKKNANETMRSMKNRQTKNSSTRFFAWSDLSTFEEADHLHVWRNSLLGKAIILAIYTTTWLLL